MRRDGPLRAVVFRAVPLRAGDLRAVERAAKLRVSADSARAASQPKSAVPLPGGMGGAMPPQGAPQQAPAPAPNGRP